MNIYFERDHQKNIQPANKKPLDKSLIKIQRTVDNVNQLFLLFRNKRGAAINYIGCC